MEELKIVRYEYDVVAEKAVLCMSVGEDIYNTEDVDGWNISLIKREIWSDGDKVQCNCVHITATTKEEETKYLVDIARTTAIFTLMFELKLPQWEVIKMFAPRK